MKPKTRDNIIFWTAILGVVPVFGLIYGWVTQPVTNVSATVQSYEWKREPLIDSEPLSEQFWKLIPPATDPASYRPFAQKLSALEKPNFASFSRIKVTNFGKLKATGVTINWPASGLLKMTQQSGTEGNPKPFNGSIDVGELRPRHSVEILAWSDRRFLESEDGITMSHDNGAGTVFMFTNKLSFLDKTRYEFAEKGIASLVGYFFLLYFIGLAVHFYRNGIQVELVRSSKSEKAKKDPPDQN